MLNRSPGAAAVPEPRGAFDLVDHFGRHVTERSFGSRYLLVFFGFTHCAIVCPRELRKLGRALGLLGSLASRVQPLYITVDPARDDPGSMQRFLAQFEGGFLGLTGSVEQTVSAKKSYRVFADKVADSAAAGGYVVPHTALTYLMSPHGEYLTHFSPVLEAEAIAARIAQTMARAGSAVPNRGPAA